MSFENTVRQYLQSFQKNVKDARIAGAGSLEMATRPGVHGFICSMVEECRADDVDIVVGHDTVAGSASNRPDWCLSDAASLGVFCFGDHKSLAQNAKFKLTGPESSQIERYLALGNPVFVFDGVEFLFFDPATPDAIDNPVRDSLVPKPLAEDADWSKLPVSSTVEDRFRLLLENSGTRQWTETQLIEQLALRARMLSDTIGDLLTAPRDSGTDSAENALLDALHDLQDMAAANHDPTLRDAASCADFIAQVLVFGLFFAHTQAPKVDSDLEARTSRIHDFWLTDEHLHTAETLRPFATIATELSTSLQGHNNLAAWYADVANLLAHAEYVGTVDGPHDFHALFEKFLTAFNPRMRFDRGAFYTPNNLTVWMAEATDQLCRENFGGGVASVAERVIDPCCGTGGFLEAVVGLGVDDSATPPILVGLEVLPAPYALANYRLSRVTDGTPYEDRVRLLLTDTLSDQLVDPPAEGVNGFGDEAASAATYSKPPLHVVIGNPPSSLQPASAAPRQIISGKLEAFRPPKSMRSDRQNVQKALNNEAYLFLRWCADRVLDAGSGVLSLVLPGSFLHSVSTKFARKWLAENFDDIWVLELDTDNRTGASGSSIFQVLQGRSVMFAVKRTPGSPAKAKSQDAPGTASGVSTVRYLDVSGRTLEEKRAFLAAPFTLDSFTAVACEEPDWAFAPTAPYPQELWSRSWPLRTVGGSAGIFRTKCSGIKMAPSSVLFHTQAPLLLRRARETATKTYADAIQTWYAGQQKPPAQAKFTAAVRSELERTDLTVVPYTYRPFVYGSAIIDPGVFAALASAPGDGTRMRPEVLAAFAAGAQALIVAPAPRDLGSTMTRFVSFAPHLPDNENAARGNGMVHADLEAKPDGNGGTTVVSNVQPEAEALFADSPDPAQEMLFYAYAVMNSRSYLEAFEPVLYTTSNPDSPPRVPLAADADLRREIARLGREAAACETPSLTAPMVSSVNVQTSASPVEFALKRGVVDADAGTLVLSSETGEEVRMTGISADVLLLRISGHDVIPKWLRERTYPYLRRKFNQTDLDELLALVNRIYLQQEILEKVDTLVSQMIDSGDLVEPPAA